LHHLDFEPLLRHNPVARLARWLDAGRPQARWTAARPPRPGFDQL